MTTNKLYRTGLVLLGALCLAKVALGQTILAPSQVGNIGTNDWNLSQPFYIPFGTVNPQPVLTAYTGDDEKNVGLLQFDLTGITAPVASAKLEIYQALNQLGAGSTASFGLFQNLSSWTETIEHWSDLPAVAPTAVATNLIADSDVGLFRSWDVTTIVNAWISGSEQNFGLRLERTDALSPYLYFAASDSDAGDAPFFAPKLTLTDAPIASPVPEPSTYGLFGALALMGLAIRLRVRRHAA